MQKPWGFYGWSLGVACLLCVDNASAQDAAAASALFDKGVSDLRSGHFESACPALEESQRLDPHAGTLFTLADCQAKWGKVASAVGHYQDYIGLVSQLPADQRARHKPRVAIANAQLAKLKSAVPTLTLLLPSNAPAGTSVSRNGVELQGAALGLALPVDPGEYAISTRAPGGPEQSVTVSIAAGETQRILLEVRAAESTPALASSAPPAEPPPAASPSSNSDHGLGTQRIAALAVGVIGVVGLGVGTGFGLKAMSNHSDAEKYCTGTSCTSSLGASAGNGAHSAGNIATVAMVVGAVGLAGGLTLWLTAPKSEYATEVRLGLGSMQVRGSW